MPATIIIRIADEGCARSCLAAGAKDLAESFLPGACIHPSKVTVIYRSPVAEAKAAAGRTDYAEHRSQWPVEEADVTDSPEAARKWEIKYDNDTDPESDGFVEWWSVTDGVKSFRCSSAAEADWLWSNLQGVQT